MVFGKTSEQSPSKFYIFTSKGESVKTLNVTCEHDSGITLLPITIQDTEYISVTCRHCSSVRLLNDVTGKVTEAFSDSRLQGWDQLIFFPDGTLRITYSKEKEIFDLFLDASVTNFHIKDETGPFLDNKHGKPWIRTRDVALVVGIDPTMIRGVERKTGNILWKISGHIDGAPCKPCLAMLYENLFLVFDEEMKRILVINKDIGNCIQSIDLRHYIEAISGCSGNGDHLLIQQKSSGGIKVFILGEFLLTFSLLPFSKVYRIFVSVFNLCSLFLQLTLIKGAF